MAPLVRTIEVAHDPTCVREHAAAHNLTPNRAGGMR
jgi:hypothetical protein